MSHHVAVSAESEARTRPCRLPRLVPFPQADNGGSIRRWRGPGTRPGQIPKHRRGPNSPHVRTSSKVCTISEDRELQKTSGRSRIENFQTARDG